MEPRAQQWRLRPLVLSLVLSALLFVTYAMHATAGYWHAIDTWFAFALNGWVATDHVQQLIWSVGNMRLFDYVTAVIMLAVLLHYVARGARATPSVRAAQAVVISVMLVVLVSITRNLLFQHLPHDSPSLVLEPFTRLTQTNSLDFKDSSTVSFPGDHATVVATFVFLLWVLAGWRYGLTAFVIAIIACLPRLVAGAHWLTDDVVGGVGTALATVPWVVYTPLAGWLVERLAPPLAGLGYRVAPGRRKQAGS